MYKVVTRAGEELYYTAKSPKQAQKKAEEEGHIVAMVVKAKACGGDE